MACSCGAQDDRYLPHPLHVWTCMDSYKIIFLSVVIIKSEKKGKKTDVFRINIVFLINVSRLMHFGKSGRCKSLQCWMMNWMCV